MEYKTLKKSELTLQEIEDKAEEIAQKYEYDSIKRPIENLVRQLGGTIENKPREEERSESIIIFGHGEFKIYLSPYTSYFRDVFTMAHELGHYFIHSNEGKENPTKANRYGTDILEIQANRFGCWTIDAKGKIYK